MEEGFVGWMKIDESSPGPATNGKGEGEVKEVQVRGVRVCKDCWGTVSYVEGPRGRPSPVRVCGTDDVDVNRRLRIGNE